MAERYLLYILIILYCYSADMNNLLSADTKIPDMYHATMSLCFQFSDLSSIES